MRTTVRTCARCGREISIGEDYLTSPVTGKDRAYCCEECMVKDILDSDEIEAVAREYVGDKAEWYVHEPDDLYDRYGVSRGDF